MLKYIWMLAATMLLFACDESNMMMECEIPASDCVVGDVVHFEVPNLSLDDWDFNPEGYYQPQPNTFWTTPNEALNFYDEGAVVERADGDNAYQGQGFAAELITRSTRPPFSQSLPIAAGALISGRYTTDLSDPVNSVNFGRPFNRRIASVSGYYKYVPVGNDACGMYALMRKCRLMTDDCGVNYSQLDTLGIASIVSSATVEEYTHFTMELTYRSIEIPDEVIIFFTSSNQAHLGIGGIGSTLFIDALEVDYL